MQRCIEQTTDRAREILASHANRQRDGWVDIEGLAGDLGYEVVYESLLPRGLEGLQHGSLIVINGASPTLTQRWTVAHELSHAVLGVAGIAITVLPTGRRSVGGSHVDEWRVNMLAGMLLMPEAAVRACWERRLPVVQMAEYFGVPLVAICARLMALHLAPPGAGVPAAFLAGVDPLLPVWEQPGEYLRVLAEFCVMERESGRTLTGDINWGDIGRWIEAHRQTTEGLAFLERMRAPLCEIADHLEAARLPRWRRVMARMGVNAAACLAPVEMLREHLTLLFHGPAPALWLHAGLHALT